MQLLTLLLNNDQLLQKARSFDNSGVIIQDGFYSYLKINDEYIHELYNLIKDSSCIIKQGYFCLMSSIGAHITLLYPEENVLLNPQDIGAAHSFSIISFNYAEIGSKSYLVVIVSSESLSLLRLNYKLSAKPNYKGSVSIEFHITIAKYL